MHYKTDAKAPVILPNGEKIYPTKGTPQGGSLSPLLANIVLNELDWWLHPVGKYADQNGIHDTA